MSATVFINIIGEKIETEQSFLSKVKTTKKNSERNTGLQYRK